MIKEKRCSTCKLSKSLDNFHKDKNTKDGLAYRCKECRYLEYKKDYDSKKEQLKIARRKAREKKLGRKVGKIEYSCFICGEIFKRHPTGVKNKQTITCSRTCSAKRLKETMLGEQNPNFGNSWNEKQKERQSQISTARFQDSPELRYLAGTANRGVKFTPERVEKCHGNRTKESYTHDVSAETRKKIGKASAEKFTPEFKKNMRRVMEQSGYWTPLESANLYEIYRSRANWVEQMFDRASEEERILLRTLGVFCPFENPNGVVRDHMYSRKSGFENKVFPEIVRHPENCAIITTRNNVRKQISKNISSDSQSLEQIFQRIRDYKGCWKEQSVCLDLIERFENGERYDIQNA